MHFRAGVVVVVCHPDERRVLVFERKNAPGQWQFPQGGMDTGETPLQSAHRELREETGLSDAEVRLLGEFPEWLAYQWPEGMASAKSKGGLRLGQVHRWFFFELLDASTEPRCDLREFVDWQWVTPQWILDRVIEFRRTAYRRALGEPGGLGDLLDRLGRAVGA